MQWFVFQPEQALSQNTESKIKSEQTMHKVTRDCGKVSRDSVPVGENLGEMENTRVSVDIYEDDCKTEDSVCLGVRTGFIKIIAQRAGRIRKTFQCNFFTWG